MQIMEKIVDFKKLSIGKKQVLFEELETFDRQIFPNAIPEELHQLVYNPDVVALPIIRFYHRGKVVGQNIIAISKLKIGHQPLYILSSRAAFFTRLPKSK